MINRVEKYLINIGADWCVVILCIFILGFVGLVYSICYFLVGRV
jgi:hypothetical protein